MEFPTWLSQQIQRKGWTKAEFARRANVSQAQVSRVLNGEQGAGREFCAGAARALGLPPGRVSRLAGLVPSYTVTDEERQEFMEVWDCLLPARREQLQELADMFLQMDSENAAT